MDNGPDDVNLHCKSWLHTASEQVGPDPLLVMQCTYL